MSPGNLSGSLRNNYKGEKLDTVDAVEDNKTPTSLLSLNATKAFDRLEWSFLWSVFDVMGFGNTFIGMIKVMYSNPSARSLIQTPLLQFLNLHA